MRYEGAVYRPPSEAYSLIIQLTLGCAHNGCTFCSMFKSKKFRVRKMAEIKADLQEARRTYRQVRRIFLADGDALVLPESDIMEILAEIERLFPECERVGIYASPQDVLAKGGEALTRIKTAGLGIIYLGAESGSDRVLRAVNKGATAAQITEAIRIAEDAGIPVSATFISGLAGATAWEDHALETGKMISAAAPSYIGLLTLMIDDEAPISREIESGEFTLLSAEGVIEETIMMIENIHIPEGKDCVFRSNHASNYFSLRGNLPADKDAMLTQLLSARKNSELLKDERFRLL